MKPVRITASILFISVRLAAFFYAFIGLYSLLSIAFDMGTLVIKQSQSQFYIVFPFTKCPFILGDFNEVFITEMITIAILYSIFFWLLGEVFNVFRQDKLFTQTSVSTLKIFYLFNLIIPSVVLIMIRLFTDDDNPIELIAILHAVTGVFAFFMSEIFKKGLELQIEKDLFV